MLKPQVTREEAPPKRLTPSPESPHRALQTAPPVAHQALRVARDDLIDARHHRRRQLLWRRRTWARTGRHVSDGHLAALQLLGTGTDMLGKATRHGTAPPRRAVVAPNTMRVGGTEAQAARSRLHALYLGVLGGHGSRGV